MAAVKPTNILVYVCLCAMDKMKNLEIIYTQIIYMSIVMNISLITVYTPIVIVKLDEISFHGVLHYTLSRD